MRRQRPPPFVCVEEVHSGSKHKASSAFLRKPRDEQNVFGGAFRIALVKASRGEVRFALLFKK